MAALLPSELAWFLTVFQQRESHFSHERGRGLGFEVVVSLAHCEPPFLAPEEKQKLG